MKYIDINRKFTEAVSSYIARGYMLNSSTMGGSQGEVAAVDLTNGKQIVRVLLDDFTDRDGNHHLEGLQLIVGIATNDVNPHSSNFHDTVWNNKLEVISCEKFYELNNVGSNRKFYGTREEAVAAEETRFDRYCTRDCRIKRNLPTKANEVVKPFIRRKFGVKRIINDNILVSKRGNAYIVTYNNHCAQLH